MDAAPAKKRVAIIGAGISGLAAIKECLAEGLEVQAFEKGAGVGGQWNYTPDPKDDTYSSMYAGCILNSCRDSTGFTDFPMDPARLGDFFSHRLMLEYINEYAEHFDLKKWVRFSTKVVRCLPGKEGGWTVEVQTEGKEVESHSFDALICGAGMNATPAIPDFKDRDLFSGQFFHSHYYRTPGPFEGKRVVVIGLGSSAADIVCEVAPHAKELTVISRRGAWILPRYVLGKPSEAWDNRATQMWLPSSIDQWILTKLFYLLEGVPPKELHPEHRLLEQNPAVRGDFTEKLRTGVFSIQRTEVDSFTKSGVLLSNGKQLEADVIICCTGYEVIDFTYLPDDAVKSRDVPAPAVDLYKLCVSPWYEDLYILGKVELHGPAPPVIEAQARFTSAMISGRNPRPSREHMLQDISKLRAWQAKNLVHSQRHIYTIKIVEYIDSLLAPLGANPTLGRLFSRIFTSGSPWQSWKLLNAVFFGVPVGAQWRLLGHGNKEELARETILRIAAGKKEFSKVEAAQIAI